MKCFNPTNVKLKVPIWSKYDQRWINNVPVGCGKCEACITRKIREWTFRLDNERINSVCTYFVTLTYDNYHVPINKYGKMTLEKKDVQLFIKRLRQIQSRNEEINAFEKWYFKEDITHKKIKYYAVGEYGSGKSIHGTGKKRPHYHLILYNASKEAIRKAWDLGEVDIQLPRSSQAMGYTVKYLSKRIWNITPGNVAREFSIMSKGIGDGYLKKMKGWHKRNLDVLYTSSESTTKVPMSKYYREKIFNQTEKDQQIPIIKKNIEEQEAEEMKKFGENYDKKMQHKKISYISKFKSKSNLQKRKDL